MIFIWGKDKFLEKFIYKFLKLFHRGVSSLRLWSWGQGNNGLFNGGTVIVLFQYYKPNKKEEFFIYCDIFG
ncbi:hypothetical protein C7972_102353 [Arenibacter sp. ARW7G5Y1]|nr:hypothetical protein C7972_102353 [Arenibacter sp. ARW7G5Y1]